MVSKQPRRTDLTLDLKSIIQITYSTMFVWTVLAFFGTLTEERRTFASRVVGIAATKNCQNLNVTKMYQKAKMYYLKCFFAL